MGYRIKLPPKKCNDCKYHASGGAFKKEFLSFWYGKDTCPKCKSKNIIKYSKPIIKNVY